VHERTTQQGRTTFSDHGVNGWTIGPTLDHYRHWEFFMPKTRGTRVSDTVGEFPPKPCRDMEINNWDGQTHCPRTDCFEAPILAVCRARAITNPTIHSASF
jgi:hypothetical protein